MKSLKDMKFLKNKKVVIISVAAVLVVVVAVIIAVVCSKKASKSKKAVENTTKKEVVNKKNKAKEDKTEDDSDKEDVVEYKGLLEGNYNSSLTIYYFSPWDETYVCYGFKDDIWTEEPGVEMKKTDIDHVFMCEIPMDEDMAIYMRFNNGQDKWDKNKDNDYMLPSGSYILYKYKIVAGTYDDVQKVINGEEVTYEEKTCTIEPDDVEKDSSFSMYYYSPFKKPTMQYKVGKGNWSESVEFRDTATFGLLCANVPIKKGQYVEVRFDDGDGNVLDNNGANFKISDGEYAYFDFNNTVHDADYKYCLKLYKGRSDMDYEKYKKQNNISGSTSKSSSNGKNNATNSSSNSTVNNTVDNTANNITNSTTRTQEPVTEEDLLVYYCTSWLNPHISVSTNQYDLGLEDGNPMEKTDYPGLFSYRMKIKSNEKAYLRFNNGQFAFDFENYSCSSGSYIIFNKTTRAGTYEDAVRILSSDVHNYATLYYHAPATWTECRLQYGTDSSNWKAVMMEKIDEANNVYKITIDLLNAERYEACFDNNAAERIYDNNNVGNYKLQKGVSRIKNGTVTRE